MAKKAFQEFKSSVTFGGVGIGETTARIGMVLDRKSIRLEMAGQLFCDRRLTGRVVLGAFDEADNQQKLIKDADEEVVGSFDVKGFRCNADHISIGATFSLKEIDIATFAKFSKGHGRLIVEDVGDIPEPPKAEGPVTQHLNGSLKAEGPWRKVNLDTLFQPGKTIRKGMAERNVNYVGELADWTTNGKLLTDFPGVGPGKANEIEDVMDKFWKANEGAGEE